MFDRTQEKEQLWTLIQARADTIQNGGDVFAHGRPVGTRAFHFDFLRRRKQPGFFPGQNAHDTVGETALQQFDQGTDAAGAFAAERLPF